MKSKVTYKIYELEKLGVKLGVYTVRKEESVGRIKISSLVFQSDSEESCKNYIKGVSK